MLGLAAVAFASNALCKTQDKRASEYQVAVAALFVGLLCTFCGMVMMGSGMGLGLFTGARSAGMGMGYGGGYGGYY